MSSKLAPIGCGLLIIFAVVLYALGFWWQYTTMLPSQTADPINSSWYNGFLHGTFAMPNLIVNIIRDDENATIFQAGAGIWYQLWFIFGIGSFAGGGSSGLRSRS